MLLEAKHASYECLSICSVRAIANTMYFSQATEVKIFHGYNVDVWNASI